MKINNKHILLVLVLLMISVGGFGQAVPPPIPPPPPPGLPIDEGVGFLLIAGIVYGVKNYIKR